MSDDKRGMLAEIFIALMIFTGLVWVSTVAFIISWPWEKSTVWKPEFRVVAVCANQEPCGFAYSDLADARAKGLFTSLTPAEPAGDIQEERTGSSGRSTTASSRSRPRPGTSRRRSATGSKAIRRS